MSISHLLCNIFGRGEGIGNQIEARRNRVRAGQWSGLQLHLDANTSNTQPPQLSPWSPVPSVLQLSWKPLHRFISLTSPRGENRPGQTPHTSQACVPLTLRCHPGWCSGRSTGKVLLWPGQNCNNIKMFCSTLSPERYSVSRRLFSPGHYIMNWFSSWRKKLDKI